MPSNSKLLRALYRPVDAASLAVFRVVFGTVMLVEIARYWSHGWIHAYYAAPKHFFSYPFFEWVRPLPGIWLDVQFDVLAFAAMCIVLGLFTRAAAAVFAIGFGWWFLSDQTNYLNHFYLIALVSILLVFVPTERAFSLDALDRSRAARAKGEADPGPATVPAWAVWLMRFQIGIPYLYGGIAKLNSDWLAGEPIRMWLKDMKSVPILGAVRTQEWCVWTFVSGGLLLDLLVVPALLFKRTRLPAFLAVLLFHGTNSILFSIGVFPWLMIAATTIFFEPDWPRRLWARSRASRAASVRPAPTIVRVEATAGQRVGLAAMGGWVAFQTLLPLRHFLYPGLASWTEEGHLYSWHMKLRDKSGSGKFTAKDPETGKTWEIDPLDYLAKRQAREMVEHPDMILQFAHIVAEEHEKETGGRLEVRARVLVSLNGRKPQPMIDPDVDLAAEPRSIGHWSWIWPLTEPLRPR